MATFSTTKGSADFSWDRLSPFILPAALLGIPAAGAVALVLDVEIPRAICGTAQLLPLAAEIGSLTGVIALVFALRSCLSLPAAPRGFYRNVLDFLAMKNWQPPVKAALAGLIVLPLWWYLRSNTWQLERLWRMGPRALATSDVQNELDGIAVVFQMSLLGGVPLLFLLHMFCRWKPASRVLPWLLIPFLFVGAAIAMVAIVTVIHFSN